MVQGSTNAVIQQGRGGGDMVTAVNNTGAALSIGDKVWLNKHNLDENEAYSLQSNNVSQLYGAYFFNGSDIYEYNLYANRGSFSRYAYSATEKEWSGTLLYTLSLYESGNGIRQVDGKYVAFNCWSRYLAKLNILLNKESGVGINGDYLGDSLVYNKNSRKLAQVDETTGVEGEVYYTFNDSSVYSGLKDGNVLLLSGTGGSYFYNIETLTAPVLLKEVPTNKYPIQYVTGLQPGDYALALTKNTSGGYNNLGNLVIYQITEDYALVDPSDLPASLQDLLGTAVSISYLNNILTVGTADNVYAFKFENGQFTELGLTITLPPESTDKEEGYPYVFYISEDLTTAVISWRVINPSSPRYSVSFYKLTTSSDGWFAEGFGEVMPQSLTGFAIEAADAGADVEVKTVIS